MQCHNAYGYQNSYNRRFTPGLPVLTFHGTSHHWGGRDVSASRHIALLLSDVIVHQRRYPAGTRPWDDSRRNLMGFPRTLTVTKILSATITSPMSKRIAPCTANRWPEFLSEALTALYLSCFVRWSRVPLTFCVQSIHVGLKPATTLMPAWQAHTLYIRYGNCRLLALIRKT